MTSSDKLKSTEFPPRPERATGDHLGRTDKDFAIEFGCYLATAAEHYMATMSNELATRDDDAEAWRALQSAIYEFRKRVEMLK